MGILRHHTLVVTSVSLAEIIKVHIKAKELFETALEEENVMSSNIISKILNGISNEQYSFFISPDGSKEGWEVSNRCNDTRKELIKYIDNNSLYCQYVEVYFGGDNNESNIIKTNK